VRGKLPIAAQQALQHQPCCDHHPIQVISHLSATAAIPGALLDYPAPEFCNTDIGALRKGRRDRFVLDGEAEVLGVDGRL
jgi:hypothetical protein